MSVLRRLTRPLTRRVGYFADWLRRLRFPRALTFGFYWSFVATFFMWLLSTWQNQRSRDLLLGLPGLIGIIVVLVFMGNAQIHERSLSTDYYKQGKSELIAENYGRAYMLLSRVLSRGDSNVSDAQYAMALLFEKTDQKERASELFSILAPDDSVGNLEAHRRMAILLAEKISPQSSPMDVKRLYWHLSIAGDDDTTEIAFAWGRYSLAIGDVRAAGDYFRKAVHKFPELWQLLGRIEVLQGNPTAATTYFRKSTDYLSTTLRDDPKNDRVRMDYANVLMKLGDFSLAEKILEQGLLVNPDGQWARQLATLTINLHDMHATKRPRISESLDYISRALKYDPNHGPAFNRLMSYATADVKGNIELKRVLARVIAEGTQPALAHLAMGNLCWLENNHDQALFHFEQAMRVKDDMGQLMNNLAWLLAHDEEDPDLDRALALINSALEESPNDARYLDTRGTILLFQKKWKEALPDFEKSLSGVGSKSLVHRKLATIYSELGMQEIADEHTKLAEQEMTTGEG